MTVDFSLHGQLGVRLIDARARDRLRVLYQLGPLDGSRNGEPDVSIRFVDRIEHGRLTYVAWPECAFDDSRFYLLRGRGHVQAKAMIPMQDVGGPCEIVCERALPEVPLLIPLLNLAALGKGILPLHASAFVHRGRGVLVTGWAKGGKTEALLAFMDRGAMYVGDEWVYLTTDGRMFGLPEPIRLWRWQVQQLPEFAARLRRSSRLRMDLLGSVAALADRLTPRRSGGLPGSVLRRATPVLRRQVNVRVAPSRLFGPDRIHGPTAFDAVVLMSSHEGTTITVDDVAAEAIAARMLSSLEYERSTLLAYYRQFRFAFPDRPSPVLDRAPAIEAELAGRALRGLPAAWLRHPYPCDIASLFDPIAARIGTADRRPDTTPA